MKKFEKPKPGEWVRPVPRGYKAACCDCGLVHRIDFRVEEGRAEFRVFPAPRLSVKFRQSKGSGVFMNLVRLFNNFPGVKLEVKTYERKRK